MSRRLRLFSHPPSVKHRRLVSIVSSLKLSVVTILASFYKFLLDAVDDQQTSRAGHVRRKINERERESEREREVRPPHSYVTAGTIRLFLLKANISVAFVSRLSAEAFLLPPPIFF